MRIAIVNDMVLAVEALRRVLNRTDDHQLAWVARTGVEAVAFCARDRPDLILMDLIMPEMDGIEATRRIMAETPCAIVVVTASVGRHSAGVFEAMGAGALDAVNTPVLGTAEHARGSHALLVRIDTIARLSSMVVAPGTLLSSRTRTHAHRYDEDSLVAIGASAGGPAALARILSALPENFPAGVIVVQHVNAQFAPDLARWLNRQTPLPVRLAQEGDHPEPGTVLLAGGEDHLVFGSPTRLSYTRFPVDNPYRPSINVFFESVLEQWRGEAVGLLLTGMGRDGVEGLKSLRDSGYHTIAQDEGTSAVYGMPKAAAEVRAACQILSVNEIGPHLIQRFE
jgi:two-component system, chemotaxis family, response regulator WspF